MVIGSGILGAAIGYHLARHGEDVTVLEQDLFGGATSASAASFGWVNAAVDDDDDYFELKIAAMRYLRSFQDGGASWFRPSGATRFVVDQDTSAMVRHVERCRSAGIPVESVSASAADGWAAGWVPVGASAAWRFPHDGWIDAPAMIRWLVAEAESFGATCRDATPVAGVAPGSGGEVAVRLACGEELLAGTVVLAAGALTNQLAGQLGAERPLVDHSGTAGVTTGATLLVADAEPGSLQTVVSAGRLYARPHSPRTVALCSGESFDLSIASGGDDVLANCGRVLEAGRQRFPALRNGRVTRVCVGDRPIPRDGRPTFGRSALVPAAYFAATHSGATVGLLAGKLIADELVGASDGEVLRPFRPDRFHHAEESC